MEAVYPLCGRSGRRRRAGPRQRRRTAPATFADIEEVDEEQEVCEVREVFESAERRRRPDELELTREFTEFRRRRAARPAPREPREAPNGDEPPAHAHAAPSHSADDAAPSKTYGQLLRASSEPT